MRRIYFLVPDIGTTHNIVNELLLARVDERHIHVLARQGTPLENLPEASFVQKSDFIPALEQGVAVGGATGLLAGLAAVALPTGLVLGGGAILAASLAGAGLGGWWSSMIGASSLSGLSLPAGGILKRGGVLVGNGVFFGSFSRFSHR